MSPATPLPPPTAQPLPPSARRWGWPARLSLITLLVLVAALGAAEWAGWPFLRAPLEQRLGRLAAVPVTITAPFRIQLLGSPTLTAARFTVAAAAGTAAPFLLDASDVQLSLRWADMWAAARGRGVRVLGLQADNLNAHLIRNDDGRASWQVGAQPDAAASAPMPAPVIERLSVRRAQVAVDDRPSQLKLDVQVTEIAKLGAIAELAPAKGAAGAASAGRAASASSAAGAAAASAAAADCQRHVGTALAPCVRITASGTYRRAPVRAQFDVNDMLALHAPQRASAPMAKVTGQAFVGRAMLKFAGGLAGLATAPALSGDLMATGPSLGLVMAPLGVNLPQTPPFLLHGRIGLSGPVWKFDADRIELGTSRLAGSFLFDTAQQPVYLSGQLRGKLLALQDLGPSVGVQPTAAERGRALPEKQLDIPSLNVMNADVDVAIDSFGFGTAAVAPLSALRVAVSLREGLLKLDKLSAQVAGGTVRGSSSLQAKDTQAQWKAALQFDGIALSQWLRALQVPPAAPGASAAPAATAAPVPYASGTLQARVSLVGQGRSVAEVLGGADGQVQATLSQATLSHLLTEAAGLDVAEALGVLIRGDRSLSMRCARVQARVAQGIVGPVQGLVDNTDTVFRLDGQINLRNEALDLRLVAKPKDFSPLSLRSPVHVRGNLAQPRLSVEAGPITARIVGALALGAVAPLLAWLPLVDAGEAKAEDPCAQPSADKTAAVEKVEASRKRKP